MFQMPVFPFHNDRVVASREEPILNWINRERDCVSTFERQTLRWSTSSSSKVWNKRWSIGDYLGDDATLTCPDNWRRSALSWQTGELGVPFDKSVALVVRNTTLKFKSSRPPSPLPALTLGMRSLGADVLRRRRLTCHRAVASVRAHAVFCSHTDVLTPSFRFCLLKKIKTKRNTQCFLQKEGGGRPRWGPSERVRLEFFWSWMAKGPPSNPNSFPVRLGRSHVPLVVEKWAPQGLFSSQQRTPPRQWNGGSAVHPFALQATPTFCVYVGFAAILNVSATPQTQLLRVLSGSDARWSLWQFLPFWKVKHSGNRSWRLFPERFLDRFSMYLVRANLALFQGTQRISLITPSLVHLRAAATREHSKAMPWVACGQQLRLGAKRTHKVCTRGQAQISIDNTRLTPPPSSHINCVVWRRGSPRWEGCSGSALAEAHVNTRILKNLNFGKPKPKKTWTPLSKSPWRAWEERGPGAWSEGSKNKTKGPGRIRNGNCCFLWVPRRGNIAAPLRACRVPAARPLCGQNGLVAHLSSFFPLKPSS